MPLPEPLPFWWEFWDWKKNPHRASVASVGTRPATMAPATTIALLLVALAAPAALAAHAPFTAELGPLRTLISSSDVVGDHTFGLLRTVKGDAIYVTDWDGACIRRPILAQWRSGRAPGG